MTGPPVDLIADRAGSGHVEARAELKRYAAELAIGLAERKIRTRMNAETQDGLVTVFVQELETPPETRIQ